jgi:predicted permease
MSSLIEAAGSYVPLMTLALASSFEILGGFAIPLMLLTLGHTLATLTVASIGRGLMLACFHLVMALATGFGPANLFGFTGIERGVFILTCLMPVSVATVRRALHTGFRPRRREPDSGFDVADGRCPAGGDDVWALGKRRLKQHFGGLVV